MTQVLETQTYRGYVLDPFQLKAITAIDSNASVLVSAPTGTGKTLIADYVIERSYKAGQQVIYTAPIKALSNQKFKEFKRLLGEENVGILTGDLVVNPEAPVLIMTTEIFRNLLHQNPDRLSGVAYTVFDEIHYIDDPARGSVWEESLIFMPPHMRFLGLSATIPNVAELAHWIGKVQGHNVEVIRHFERAVPLEHNLFESGQGFCTRDQLAKRYYRYARKLGTTESGKLAGAFPPTTHLELLSQLSLDYLPCLFFAFSRRRCESHARQLAEERDFLSPQQKERVRQVIDAQLARHSNSGARLRDLETLLLRGVGYHHAGLLPLAKDIVEELFEERLIQVLYCTETFAVGLNFPCKTVCFDAVTKWDGTTFRALSNREYFQIAGRAGRRGIDEKGYVFTVADMNFFNPEEFPTMKETDVEPLRSRFGLSYNSVLNLVRNYSEEEIEDILQKNFAAYQTSEERRRLVDEIKKHEDMRLRSMGCPTMDMSECPLQFEKKRNKAHGLRERIKQQTDSGDMRGVKSMRRTLREIETEMNGLAGKQCEAETVSKCRSSAREFRQVTHQLGVLRRRLRDLSPADAYIEEFREKRALLMALDYLRDDMLTARGEFAAQINGQELLVTELFFRGVFHDWSESELNALCVSLDYEPRKGEGRAKQRVFDEGVVRRIISLLQSMEETYLGYSTGHWNVHLADAAYKWSEGGRFSEIVQSLQIDEGDVVYSFRRALDVLRQVRNATRDDPFLNAKLRGAMERVDRDEVSILL